MKKITISFIIVFFSLPAFAQRDSTQLMLPSSFNWDSIAVTPTKNGERRQFFDSRTTTLANMECHVTTLKPGEISHPPHQHPEEEMLIIKEGTVDVLVNGELKRVGPGSVIFQTSNRLHNIINSGKTAATYYAIKWKVASR